MVLTMDQTSPTHQTDRRYATGELVRRLLGLAWQFRADCLYSLFLSVIVLLLGLAGLQLLGVVIDVIRKALDPTLGTPISPYGWTPPATWTPIHVVVVLSLAIVGQA